MDKHTYLCMLVCVCIRTLMVLIASSYILAKKMRKKRTNERSIENMCISNLFCFPLLLLLLLFSVSFLLWQAEEHEKSIINYIVCM